MLLPYQLAGQEAQKRVIDSIPEKWILSPSVKASTGSNVIDVPRTCGILTERQLEITEQNATQLLKRLAVGDISSVEVTEAFCARAAIAHQVTNCLTAYFHTEALETARALDAQLKKTGKPVGPLHGLPVSIKDIYDLKGYPTTWGYVSWKDKIATSDATLIAVLREAGAVFYVKTTAPQSAMALETTSNLWGTTLNPYNTSLVSGGSSGGDGVLIALRGSPIAPGTDIGGSIRIPAAFNGLYSIRPSSDRIPKVLASGQISIKGSCGPIAHSVEDLRIFTKVINAYESPISRFSPDAIPMPWKDVEISGRKLRFGVWEFDGACMPHPPILRALRETVKKLEKAGHEVIPLKMPFDCWEVGLTTTKLLLQTGAAEIKSILASAQEPMIPALAKHLSIYDIKPLTITELYALNIKMASYKSSMSNFWTSKSIDAETPLDAILCPVHPSASYPHNFPSWWGYTSLWNILDYPSTTLPIKDFKISNEQDGNDVGYVPLENGFDKETYDMYDPEVFSSQPVCVQIVARPFQDEKLIAVTQVVDEVVNGGNAN